MDSSRRIIFYLDFISPFSYLVNARLPGIAARHDALIDYRPIDVMLAKLGAGNFAPSTRTLPAKARFIRQDRRYWAGQYGIPMIDPKGTRTLRPNIGVLYANDQGRAKDYVDAAFLRIRGLGQGTDDDELLANIASDMGWKPRVLLDFVDSPEARKRFEAGQQEAHRLGVFGVPTMMVDDQMFWGNDRLDFLEEYLAETCQPAAQSGN